MKFYLRRQDSRVTIIRSRHIGIRTPVTQNLKVRLLLKEAYDRLEIAAAIAAGDVHAAAKLSEISRALNGLGVYLALEIPLVPRHIIERME